MRVSLFVDRWLCSSCDIIDVARDTAGLMKHISINGIVLKTSLTIFMLKRNDVMNHFNLQFLKKD